MIPTSLQGLRARRVGLAGPVPVDVTRRLAGRPDGLSFGHGGRTLLGVGYAARLALPGGTQDGAGLRAVTAALSAVPAEDRLTGGGGDGDGAGDPLPHPVTAFGALPFRPEDPTVLVVPRILVGLEEDGTAWMSVVGSPPDLPEDAAAADALLASLSDPAGDTVTDRVPGEADGHGTDPDRARPTRRGDDRATFVEAVARALEAIDRGRLRKVVLGRRAEMVLPEPLPVGDLVDRWAALEPACTTFSLPVAPESGGGIMVGASPELLVARRGPDLTTRPLAGTTRHVGDRDRPVAGGMPLARSPKDGLEHRLVVEAIAVRDCTTSGRSPTWPPRSAGGSDPGRTATSPRPSSWPGSSTRLRPSGVSPSRRPWSSSDGSSPTPVTPSPARSATSTGPATGPGSSASAPSCAGPPPATAADSACGPAWASSRGRCLPPSGRRRS